MAEQKQPKTHENHNVHWMTHGHRSKTRWPLNSNDTNTECYYYMRHKQAAAVTKIEFYDM